MGAVAAAGTTRFLSGMPQGSNPTGGPVLPGDLLVVDGRAYEIIAGATTEAKCFVSPVPLANVAATANWFVVRTDTIRAAQSFNTVFAPNWNL